MVYRQFIKFAAVGAVGTTAHYALLIALVSTQIAQPVWASTAGFALGALVNYVLNYRFTFASDRAHMQALPRFLIVATSGAVLNYALVHAGVSAWHWHYLLAQVLATALVLLWTFTVNRLWTFAPRARVESSLFVDRALARRQREPDSNVSE